MMCSPINRAKQQCRKKNTMHKRSISTEEIEYRKTIYSRYIYISHHKQIDIDFILPMLIKVICFIQFARGTYNILIIWANILLVVI